MLLDEDAVGNVGLYPWNARHPIVLDMSAALALGYSPIGGYAATVADEVEWLVTATGGADAAKLRATTTLSSRRSSRTPRRIASSRPACPERVPHAVARRLRRPSHSGHSGTVSVQVSGREHLALCPREPLSVYQTCNDGAAGTGQVVVTRSATPLRVVDQAEERLGDRVGCGRAAGDAEVDGSTVSTGPTSSLV